MNRKAMASVLAAVLAMLAVSGCGGGGSSARGDSAAPKPLPTIRAKVAGMTRIDGFFPLYRDERSGTVWLEIADFGRDFLYQTSLPSGVGSNDIGLDRGKLGKGRVVRFERSGPRVLLIERNLAFRAPGAPAAERRAVQESFAESVLFGFDVAAQEDGRVLVDAGPFFVRDAFGVADAIAAAGQGDASLDASRSAVWFENTKNFPKNTEVEAVLTFSSPKPGPYVREVTPDPKAITVHERHSLVELPEGGYSPLPFDPGSGFSQVSYRDYGAPIEEPLVKRFATRHRIVRKADGSIEPIVYYIDSAAPEPVRRALMDGAGWWADAFAAAGLPGAFRVEELPDDADPMDLRYDVVQWVHRATRGWSYGDTVVDPRTGEILKGHVTLGSLRVRQDFLIAKGILALSRRCGRGNPREKEAVAMALARLLRQLAAHEVGHTLGLEHDFAASTADRASVMDYPYPLVRLNDDGTLDVSDAYATGIGAWDRVAIRWGYDPKLDAAGRAAVLDEARRQGIPYLTDEDARPSGSASPDAHLWDNGSDAVAELDRVLRVRAAILRNFADGGVIAPGAPPATLEEALVPAYLFHRYQVAAAAKVLGGVEYGYGTDDASRPRIVDAGRQRDALDSLLGAMRPDVLAIPEEVLRALPPRPPGYPRTRELFPRRTGVTFDPLAAAETAADLVARLVLDPQRAERLVEHHARDSANPSLEEVLGEVLARTWLRPKRSVAMHDELERVADHVVLARLLALAQSPSSSPHVRAAVQATIAHLDVALESDLQQDPDGTWAEHFAYAREVLRRYREDRSDRPAVPIVSAPPGDPIGGGGDLR